MSVWGLKRIIILQNKIIVEINRNSVFWSLCEILFSKHCLIIDRPKGSHHPIYPNLIYPLDYGYLEGTHSQDKEGIDVWVGTDVDDKISGIIVTIDIVKNDSEIKFLYKCTDEEIQLIENFHNQTWGQKGLLIKNVT